MVSPRSKFHRRFRRPDRDRLAETRSQVHLDALLPPARYSDDVLEPAQIEIRIQFAVDARQQIQIEGRGHARRIVVSRAQHPRSASPGPCPAAARRPGAGTDGRRTENPWRPRARSSRWCCPGTEPAASAQSRTPRWHFAQAVEVVGLIGDTSATGAQVARAPLQRRPRDIDRVIHSPLTLSEGLQNRPRLGARRRCPTRPPRVRRQALAPSLRRAPRSLAHRPA